MLTSQCTHFLRFGFGMVWNGFEFGLYHTSLFRPENEAQRVKKLQSAKSIESSIQISLFKYSLIHFPIVSFSFQLDVMGCWKLESTKIEFVGCCLPYVIYDIKKKQKLRKIIAITKKGEKM